MSGLIEGLPNAVALQCLARVPLCFHPQLKLVCRAWRAALTGPELFLARSEACAAEHFICVLAFDPENIFQLYDPLRDTWLTLPPHPTRIRHLARFGLASTRGKLFVLGGGSDHVDPATGDHDTTFASDEVWSFDPFSWTWAPCAPMLVPRAMFACGVLGDGRIVAAGGFTNCRNAISKAEIYDVDKDVWRPLPDLCQTRSSACSGVVLEGKMHVLHKGVSALQILDEGVGGWRVEDYGWLQGPLAVVRGEVYVLSHGMVTKQQRHAGARPGDAFYVTSVGELQSRIGFGMVGLGEDLYVLGGVIGPGRMNQTIKQLADVDALSVGAERLAWRSVTSMSRCRGSIQGCTVLTA